MSNKLQNTKALKELLSGQHKSQTRTSYGYTSTSTEKHEVGDVWTETDPKTGTVWRFEQKDGYRTKTVDNSILDVIRKSLAVPETCPSCGGDMRDHEKHLHFKMYFMHKKCFSCVLKEENEIRAKGKEAWGEYSKQRMLDNAQAWFTDADKEVALLREALKLQFIQNADGKQEDWDQSAFLDKFDTDYKQLKEKILNDLKG